MRKRQLYLVLALLLILPIHLAGQSVLDTIDLGNPRIREQVLPHTSDILVGCSKELQALAPDAPAETRASLLSIRALCYRLVGKSDSAELDLEWMEDPQYDAVGYPARMYGCFMKGGIAARKLNGADAYASFEEGRMLAEENRDRPNTAIGTAHMAMAHFVGGAEEEGFAMVRIAVDSLYFYHLDDHALVYSMNEAVFYIQTGDFEKGKQLLATQLQSPAQNNKLDFVQLSVLNYAFCQNQLQEYEEAITTIRAEIQAKGPMTILNHLFSLDLLAEASIGLGEWEQANRYLQQADMDDSTRLMVHHYDLGSFHSFLKARVAEHNGNLDAALHLYEDAVMRASPGRTFPNQEAAFNGIHRVALKQGDLSLVQEVFEKSNHIKDSLYFAKGKALIDLYQVKQNFLHQRAQLNEAEQQLEIQSLFRQTLLWGVIALVLGLLVLFLWFYNRSIRNRQSIIEAHNRQLSAYSQELEELAFAVSHNLLEGVRNISTMAGLFTRKNQEKLPESELTHLNMIQNSASRTATLLKDLELYVGIGRTLQSVTLVSLEEVLSQVKQSRKAEIQFYGATIGYQNLPTVCGDRELLIRLFTELTDNALKYSGDKPPVIRLRSELLSGIHRVYFTDEGIGFPEQYSGTIFRVFQRLHADKDIPGTGIGMAVASKIMTLHEGTISVRSKPGEGTTFILEFPETTREAG